MTPGGALRAAGANPGASNGEEGALQRRGAGAEGAGAWRRGVGPPRARGTAVPCLETDSETLGSGGVSNLPRGECGRGVAYR